jgi:hypothetical protein
MGSDGFDASASARCRPIGLAVAVVLALGSVLAAAPAGATPVGSSVSDVGICFGFAGSGGCQLGFGGTTTGTSDANSSIFSAALVTTSGLSGADSVVIDASGGAPGTQFGSDGYQIDNLTTEDGCAVFTPVTISNEGQTVSVPIPGACAATPGTEIVVLISGGETNPDTSGPITMQVSTTTDPDPVTTNALQLNSTVPDAPTGFTATPGDASLEVQWTAPAHTGGSPITEYDVYCSETSPPPTSGTPSATTDGTATSTVVTPLANGTQQDCVVTAVNANGPSVPSSESDATPTNLPGAPTFPNALPGNHTVEVSWSAPVPRGPLPILGFRVYCSTSNPPPTDDADLCASTAKGRDRIVRGLVPGTTYYFVITALNANGASAPSAVVNAEVGAPPTRPRLLHVVTGNRGVLRFRWTPPASDFGGAIYAYGVFCATTNPPPLSEATLLAVVGTTAARVTGLTSGTPYFCVVEAANGYGDSHPSLVVTATPN